MPEYIVKKQILVWGHANCMLFVLSKLLRYVQKNIGCSAPSLKEGVLKIKIVLLIGLSILFLHSSTSASDILNGDYFKESADWVFELIASEDTNVSLSNEAKPTRTPVPPILYLLGTGLIGLAGFRGRQRKR